MEYFTNIVSPSTSCSEQGHWGKLVQLNFSAAFDWVSYGGLLYKHRSMDIGR